MDLNPLHIINRLNDELGHDTASVLEFCHITDPAVNPAGVRSVAAKWAGLGAAVDEANQDARQALAGVVWQGKAADAFAQRAQRASKQAESIAKALHDGSRAINKFADVAEGLIEQIGVIAAQMIEFEVAGLALSVITAGLSDAASAIVTGERAMKIASLVSRIEEEGGIVGNAIRLISESVKSLRGVLESLKEVKGVTTIAKLAKEGTEFTAFTTLLEDPDTFRHPGRLTEVLSEGALTGVAFGLGGKVLGRGLRGLSGGALAALGRGFGKFSADDSVALASEASKAESDVADAEKDLNAQGIEFTKGGKPVDLNIAEFEGDPPRPGFKMFSPRDKLNRYMNKIPPIEGVFDIGVHGSPDSVGYQVKPGAAHDPKNWLNLSNRDLANIMKGHGWQDGQPVRLLSCQTGKLPNGFAQALSNRLGIHVTAPSDYLWVYPNGKTLIAPFADGGKVMHPTIRGKWEDFDPRKEEIK